MNKSALAVFDVIDEVVAPISAEVPDRPSVMEFFDPEFHLPAVLGAEPPEFGAEVEPGAELGLLTGADLVAEVEEYTRFVGGMTALGLAPGGVVTAEAVGLYRALRGGFIRGVVTGVFPARPEPWEVRFFGDEDYTTVLHKIGARARLRSGFLSSLPGWVFDGLPDRSAGPGDAVEIRTDERGFVPPEHESAFQIIRSCVARPRLGTVLVDLAVRDAILAEYPHGAFGLLDNDLGRYQFSASIDAAGRWTITWGPANRYTAEQWIARAVQRHA